MIEIDAIAAAAAQRERLTSDRADPARRHRRRAVELHRKLRRRHRP